MTSDIITRLRDHPYRMVSIRHEAAQEIERLREENQALKEQSCAGCANAPTYNHPNYEFDCMGCCRFYGDLFIEGKTS